MDLNHSIINIDKPSGWTSYDVVSYISKELNLNKAGHIGTLDPLVTGVLPICLGKATRIQGWLMKKDKTYIGKFRVHKEVTEEELKGKMRAFLGKIKQLPPVKSCVKRQIREREIYQFELLKLNKEKKEAEFLAKVEAGTYIRKLISDLGLKIGGAHMTELRRIQAGLFDETTLVTIENFKKAVDNLKEGNSEMLEKYLIPVEIIKEAMPVVNVKKEFKEKLNHGSPLFENMLINKEEAIEIVNKGKEFAVFCEERLIQVCKKTDRFKNKSIIAKPEAVLN